MTRIRYIKKENILTSKISILCNATPVIIKIDLNNMEYFISDKVTGKVLTSERASTIEQLKSKAKLATIKLGAQYLDELRNSKTRKRRLDI